MSKIIKPEFPYTDVVAVEVIREANPYADLGVDDTWSHWLHINLDKIAITAKQGEVLLRNSREIIEATEQRIIKLLEDVKVDLRKKLSEVSGDSQSETYWYSRIQQLDNYIALIKGGK